MKYEELEFSLIDSQSCQTFARLDKSKPLPKNQQYKVVLVEYAIYGWTLAKDIIKMKKTVTMEWTKSTKGTQVYSCNDTNTPVSTIYIKRNTMPDKAPKNITLTIEYYETE